MELLMLNSNSWNYLTMCKQMKSYQKNKVTDKLLAYKFAYKSFMYEQDLALNNL